MATDDTRDEAPPTEAPKTTEAGVALADSDLPFNHRLRAEALAERGDTTDPDGIVSDELIADAGERLERDANAPDPNAPPEVRANMRVADLERIAGAENIDLSGASNNEERVRLIEAARSDREA